MYIGITGVSGTLIAIGILTWSAPGLLRQISGLLTPAQFIIAVMAFFMIWFQVFSNLGLSIFYYFCTDVVPGRLIGRFMAIFMLFNSAGAFFFSYFMMPIAEKHMPWVFILEGVFLLMAFFSYCGGVFIDFMGDYRYITLIRFDWFGGHDDPVSPY